MQVQNVSTAGTLVQVVDVLRDQGELGHSICQGGDGDVGEVGLGVEDARAPRFVPAPYERRVAFKGVRCGESSEFSGADPVL